MGLVGYSMATEVSLHTRLCTTSGKNNTQLLAMTLKMLAICAQTYTQTSVVIVMGARM